MDVFDQLIFNQMPAPDNLDHTAGTVEKPAPTVLSDDLSDRILAPLNPEQRQAVLHDEGPLLILAGAGSGKTRVITHRVAYLVLVRQVHPGSILAITFTNKAAAEMKQRIGQLVGLRAEAMWVGTFHAMMLRLLRRHADRIGFVQAFTILDTDDQLQAVKAAMKELNIDERLTTPRSLHSRIGHAKNQLIGVEQYEKQAGNDFQKKETAAVYRYYQDFLRRNHAMDFDDILCYAVQLLEDHPDVLAHYQDRFRYVLVDEYQDTNHAQYRLVQLLAARHRNLCVVGDDDQSIYSFRGATIRNILDFEKDFKPCRVIKLEQNYRSTGTILAAANAVIRQNERRKDKKLWTELEPGRRITFFRAEDQHDEARTVALEIGRLADRSQQRITFGQVAILYRVNALSRNLEFSLREQGIPYRIYGGMRFFDRKEVKDVLAYLRLIHQPTDDLAFTRVINTPRRGIGDATQAALTQIASRTGLPLLAVCAQADHHPELQRVSGRLQGFAALIAGFQAQLQASELSLAEFLEQVEEKSGLIEELVAQREKGDLTAQSRIENLQELLSDAVEFEHHYVEPLPDDLALADATADAPSPAGARAAETTGLPTDAAPPALLDLLTAFLERTALYSDLDTDDDSEAVSLMTIHSAKGLEFDAVFLVGFEDGIFPGYRAQDSQLAMEEERRLAYVAITRARRELWLSAARARLLYGKTNYALTSRFAAEIPDEYLYEIGGSRKQAVRLEPAHSGPASGYDFKQASRAVKPGPAGASGGLDPGQLQTGDRIRHQKFGEGEIQQITEVTGDAILVIDFAGMQKRFVASSPLLSLPES